MTFTEFLKRWNRLDATDFADFVAGLLDEEELDQYQNDLEYEAHCEERDMAREEQMDYNDDWTSLPAMPLP